MRLPRPNRAGGAELVLTGSNSNSNSNHRHRNQYESIVNHSEILDNHDDDDVTSQVASSRRKTPIITTACVSDSEEGNEEGNEETVAVSRKTGVVWPEEGKGENHRHSGKELNEIRQGHLSSQTPNTLTFRNRLIPGHETSLANVMSSRALSIAEPRNTNSTPIMTTSTTAATPTTSGVRFPSASRSRWRDLILGDFSFNDDGER